MDRNKLYIEDLFPSNDFEYIESRFNDLRIRLVCNDCGYKFFSKKEYSFIDNLEGYDEIIDGIRCPNCGSSDVEEI
ncbi:MAG: hypothetical protein WH035_01445 [Spirochaetota bacterium]